jgi:hypothetical protein
VVTLQPDNDNPPNSATPHIEIKDLLTKIRLLNLDYSR